MIERSVPDGPVAVLLGKTEGGLDHWLTFVGEPAVSPRNNAAENALREPVVLRKPIGTLWNDRGMFVHETLLPLRRAQRVARNNELPIRPNRPKVYIGRI